MSNRWIIVGAGGHGRVVLDILVSSYWSDRNNLPKSLVFVDDKAKVGYGGVKVVTWKGLERLDTSRFVIAIGDNRTRARLYSSMLDTRHFAGQAIHPSATVSQFATIGDGVVICAGANIGPGAFIDDGVIVNTGANVDHDSHVGAFTHIAPRASLCGGVKIGQFCMIGSGAILLPGAIVGSGATVGAMSLVLENKTIGENRMVVGVPAHRELEKTNGIV